MVVFKLLLYDLRVKTSERHVIAFTLSLVVAIVVDATRGGDNHVFGAKEQGAMPVVMEIMSERWRWRSTTKKKKRLYHVTLFLHVMLILLLCILFCLERR